MGLSSSLSSSHVETVVVGDDVLIRRGFGVCSCGAMSSWRDEAKVPTWSPRVFLFRRGDEDKSLACIVVCGDE